MKSNNRYAIYGAGNVGKKIFSILSNNDFGAVEFFIDEFSTNASIEGKSIFRLSDIETGKIDVNDVTIIISIFNPYTDLTEIMQKLERYNFSSIIDFYSFYKQYSEFFDDIYWLSKPEKMVNAEKIDQVYQILSDQKSRTLFNSIINFRKNPDLSILPDIELHPQYIPDDIEINFSKINFVDCGAYTGDTIEAISEVYELDNIYCFEPDNSNFQILKQNIRRLSEEKKFRSYLWPCGVWDESKKLR